MTQPSQPLFTYFSKTASQIRDDILRTEKNGLIAQGIPDPNVGPGSDYYTKATALGNELGVVHANNVVSADAHMPDTAGGDDLDRWLRSVGLSRRGPIGSHGICSTPCSAASTAVPGDSQLTDGAGQRYQVAAGGTYTAVAGFIQVPIFALDLGAATDHENGDPLQWVNAPPFCSDKATVGIVGGTDGLTGGFDSEVGQDEPPRQRLLQRLQSPPRSGNAADVAKLATDSTPIVQAAFVYPALGIIPAPGATFFAVVGQAQTLGVLSSTSKNRDLPAALVNGIVAPFVRGNYPENTQLVGVSAANQINDIAVLLDLPAAATASPPGQGGGWLDGTPWPASVGGTAPAVVGTVTSTTAFTVVVPVTNPPTPGVSHIAWLSPLNWQLYKATVLTVGAYAGGAYPITIDAPFVGITSGAFIWPQASNQDVYVAAALGAFGGLGPGEWSASPPVLSRAFRHPRPSAAWPYALDARFLKQIETSSPEVDGATWISRTATVPTVPATITVDPVSGLLTSAPPNIFVPRNISFYAA